MSGHRTPTHGKILYAMSVFEDISNRPSIWDILDKRDKKNRPKERFRFWFPVILSLIALFIAGWSLRLQVIQTLDPQEKQSTKVRPSANPDSTNSKKP